jgi:phosphocarrier protein
MAFHDVLGIETGIGMDEPLRTTVTVRNPKGLHMRAAFAVAKLAGRFKSNITVRKQERAVNGKSGVSLMTLAALPGTELILEVIGEDGLMALPLLSQALEAPSADGLDELLRA